MAPSEPPAARGFQALATPARWRELVARGTTRPYPAGSPMIRQGERSEAVYVLRQGRVRVVYTDESGDEALLAIRGPGDLLGEYAQSDRSSHMASVWTLEDCMAAAVPSSAFEAFIRANRLERTLQSYMLGKARQGGDRLRRASRLQIEQRMAALFLEILRADPARGSMEIPMTQRLVAESLGSSLRQVADLLAQWRDRGVARTRPSIEVLDLGALIRRANRV